MKPRTKQTAKRTPHASRSRLGKLRRRVRRGIERAGRDRALTDFTHHPENWTPLRKPPESWSQKIQPTPP